MNKILYLVFILLYTSCSNIEQKNINEKENNESNINTNLALIYTEWFVNQACSLRNLAPGKYIFSKFDVTPNDIIKFQKLFDIKPSKNGIDDILNFVFKLKKCENYDELSENTSLQKCIKEFLKNGGIIYEGYGELKNKQ